MAEILHDLPIRGSIQKVFAAVTTPKGLDAWWTRSSAGQAERDATYTLSFGEGYDWSARVTRAEPDMEFELEMVEAAGDWIDTRVGFMLEDHRSTTWVRFRHTHWTSSTEHFRITSNCWALYLRLLRRYVELGDVVPYEKRLEA